MQKLVLVSAAALLCACASPPDREAPAVGFENHLSPEVMEIAKAEGGVVDTDKHTNVRCKRIKIVGTHLHKRICYTTAEEEAMAKRHQDEHYRRLGAGKR